MKKIILIFLFIITTLNICNSQPLIQFAETLFRNNTSHEIYIKLYPVSAVFSGFYSPPNENFRKYSFKRSNPNQEPFWQAGPDGDKYITGGTKLIMPNDYAVIDFDDGLYYSINSTSDKVIGGISYGLWKFEIFNSENGIPGNDTLEYFYLDERDMNHGTDFGFSVDLYLTLLRRLGAPQDSLLINFVGGDTFNIYDSRIINKTIKSWHKVGVTNSHGVDPIIPGSPNKGQFNSHPDFTVYPVYSTEYGAIKHENAGSINLNLYIDHDIITRDTLLESITNIRIESKTLLRLNDGKIFHMITPSYPSGGYTNLIIGEDSAKLQLRPNSQIIVDPPNRITLKSGGFLLKNPGSRITINPGAYLCNGGGSIRGSGIIYYTGGIHQSMCNQLTDYLLQDSIKFILDSNAVLPIPNNTTLHLRGNTTSLIMKPGSKLLFGENSGIVCDSGGKLIANNATFASVDSTKKWSGISLSGISQDTIKNCTIKNSMCGVSISNKYDSEESPFPYSTEISGCTFINQTAYVLNSAVYIAGSNNILIMNNTISSAILEKGFTHGIYAEYCPERAFNIIGNNISNSGYGMTLIGCSPFVAQNTLTGNEYSDCGLFLKYI